MSAHLASLIQSDCAAVAILPLMRKRIGSAQLVTGREEEEGSAGAVRDVKLAQRLHHRLHTVMVGRHGEHAKGFPSELPLVLFSGMRHVTRSARSVHLARESSIGAVGCGCDRDPYEATNSHCADRSYLERASKKNMNSERNERSNCREGDDHRQLRRPTLP